jgi:hypothetical protein
MFEQKKNTNQCSALMDAVAQLLKKNLALVDERNIQMMDVFENEGAAVPVQHICIDLKAKQRR